MYRQTNRLIETGIETYILTHRDIDRNIHVHACRRIHARVQIGWLIETYMYMYANVQIYWLNHTWACKSSVLQNYMGRVVWWIWSELSDEFGLSCLINMGRVVLGRVLCGPSWHGPSWFWAELSVIPIGIFNNVVNTLFNGPFLWI